MVHEKQPHFLHKEYPKTCAENDFWGQVKRTVNGQPVSEDQIEMIVQAIRRHLVLGPEDTLLDLGCGNGALSDRLFSCCKGGVGVDFSEYLIGVARKYFERQPARRYLMEDAVDFACRTDDTRSFTKANCYGVFAYLSTDRAAQLVATIHGRFSDVSKFFIGNLPDKARLKEFYRDRDYTPGVENDPDSAIGIWRTEAEFEKLANDAGWSVRFSRMPADFYAAHYRYDAILARR